MFLELVREASQSMRANRVRSMLTMLGMMIGVGAVVLMLSVGQGAQYSMQQTIQAMGSNLFVILSGNVTAGGARSGSGGGASLTVDDAQAVSELDGVAHVGTIQMNAAQIVYGSKNWSSSVMGVNEGFLLAREWDVIKGQSLSENDNRYSARVAVIGTAVAKNLFEDEDPIGKTIRIRKFPFTVIGVLATKGQSLDGRDQDDTVMIPFSTYQRQVFGSRFPNSMRIMMVKATSDEVMPELEERINALLRQRHRIREGQDDDFFLRNLTAMAETAASMVRIMSMLLGAIASVSLLVGGIGIMNIMLVSVTERTREIGLRMSIGARERDILMQFLLEAVMISVVGGLVGLLVGIGGAYVVSKIVDMTVIVSGSLALVAFGVAGSIGIFFGFYPAKKAARLDPIEALRYQ